MLWKRNSTLCYHNCIHAVACSGVPTQCHRSCGKIFGIHLKGCIGRCAGEARVGKGRGEPGRLRSDALVIRYIDGNWRVDIEGQEGRIGGALVIIGGFDIRDALHGCGDGDIRVTSRP